MPPDAFVLHLNPASPLGPAWQSVLSWHETVPTPLPASEPREHVAVLEKAAVVQARSIVRLQAWLRHRGRDGYVLAWNYGDLGPLPSAFAPVAVTGNAALFKVGQSSVVKRDM